MKILIVSGGIIHDHAWSTGQLVDLLTARRPAQCRVVAGPEELTDENLKWADLIVVNYTGGKLSKDQEKALMAFVDRGGGLVGVHSAADSFKESKAYLKLLGCEFQTHGPPTPIRIHLTDPKHQITAAVKDEFVIYAAPVGKI